jgi:hypothetical protein
MKIKQIFATFPILCVLLFASVSQAYNYLQITNAGNWNWSSTVPNQPWPSGNLPTTNDFLEVYDNIVITNDMTNAVCDVLDSVGAVFQGGIGNGKVVMAPNSTLTVYAQGISLEGYGDQGLGALDATATNCTVIYNGNSFWAMRTNYWNLVFSGWGDFYNGLQDGYPPTPMTIYGNFIVNGTNIPPDKTNIYTGCYIECGSNITVLGDLSIGPSNSYDCSLSSTVVYGHTTCAGILWDNSAGNGTNYFGGGLTIVPSAWHLTYTNTACALLPRMTNYFSLSLNGIYNPNQTNIYGGSLIVGADDEWTIGGNFTNNGLVGFGTNYGMIDFSGTGTNFGSTSFGTGVITGSNALYMPTMQIDGTYTIADTINLLTNYPTVNGTVVFDIGNTNLAFDALSNTFDPIQITLNAGTNWFWYSTNGTLDVINSGPPPISGNTYQLFNNLGNTNYGGGFASITLPSLTGGLSWVTNLLTNGSISVAGAAARPIITSSHYNPATLQFTLTWTSVIGAMYTVQETPGLSPVAWSSLQTNIASGGSTTTTTVTMPAGTKGFLRILVQ